ncbi:ATP-binding protein [Streptomyces sp. 4N509B]|uniref:ATP-binding protein n=1 Tax=Streptomyces sp. 4N509B TaxID=3457413 RepID=UPI003FD03494
MGEVTGPGAAGGERTPSDVANTVAAPVYGVTAQAGRDVHLTTVVAPPTALAGLPPLDGGFVGRRSELARLAAALRPDADGGTPAAVCVVAGLGGVGKTALAVHAARSAVDAGWFPGGVLFLNLEGYAPDDATVAPFAALATLLHALGVAGTDIPPEQAAREALYRSRLAERERPVLIVLDNASSSAQVRPLLPGGLPHRVLVTSRHTLADLGARQFDLDVLTQAEGESMVAGALRTAFPGDQRGAEAGGIAELVRLCGRLPLALGIVGAVLVRDRDRTVRELVTSLEDETTRLGRISYGGSAGVRAAFDLSYGLLDPDEARLFRLLPLHPGQEFGAEAVAALADRPLGQTVELLRSLRSAHLVLTGDRSGRYRMHDMVRLYATERSREVSARGRDRARHHLCDHYREAASSAVTWLEGDARTYADRGRFAGRADAVTWLGRERGNLTGVVHLAHAMRRDAVVEDVTYALAAFLVNDGRPGECVPLYELAVDAARRRGDPVSEGNLLGFLGWALREQGLPEAAAERFRRALALARRSGRREQEAYALDWLGLAATAAGDLDTARDHHLRALALHRRLANDDGEAVTLVNLGEVEGMRGRYEEAWACLERALALYRGAENRYGEAETLIHMGEAAFAQGDFASCRRHHEEAVGILEDLCLWHRAARTLVELGVMARDAGRAGAEERAGPEDFWRRAVEVAARDGDPEVARNVTARVARLRGAPAASASVAGPYPSAS